MTADEFPYPLPTGNHMQEAINQILLDSGNPYLFHAKGSPYLGLPLHKQKILARIRRGGKTLGKRKAERVGKTTKDDYIRFAQACVSAYVKAWYDSNTRLDRITLMLKLPVYYRRFCKEDFPRVMILAYEDWWMYVSVKVDKMVDFLYKHGHFPYPAKEFRKEIWAILQETEKMEWYYQYAAPISILEAQCGIVKDAKEGRILPRKEKGRKISKYRERKKKEKENEISMA